MEGLLLAIILVVTLFFLGIPIGAGFWLSMQLKGIEFKTKSELLQLVLFPYTGLGRLKYRLHQEADKLIIPNPEFYKFRYMALVNGIALAVLTLGGLVLLVASLLFVNYESDGTTSSWGELGIDLAFGAISIFFQLIIITVGIISFFVLAFLLVGIPLLVSSSMLKRHRNQLIREELLRLRGLEVKQNKDEPKEAKDDLWDYRNRYNQLESE